MKKSALLFAALAISATAFVGNASAGDSDRTGKWEGGFLINQVDDWAMSGRSGSGIDVDSDTGWGFSLGYNYSEHFNFAFEYSHNEQSYDATIVPADPPGAPFEVSHELDNDSFSFNFTYNILAKSFTPFVTGGLGWSYLDSNISDSDSDVYCWWDPWWGYVCNDYYSTYSDTSFSYSVGGGLRWEVGKNFVMKASVNQKWLDIDAVGDTPEMLFGKIDFLWSM